MPIYEYQCAKCGHGTEILQKFSDPPITECELCRGKMKKLISQSTFHLKGSGWYVTDYASKSSSGSGDNRTVAPKKEKETPKAEQKSASGSSNKKDSSGSKDKKTNKKA
ncbi:MAG: zinc ribbon domain-containing protein [Desulfobacterales bacterium]|nr:zinc ribbon domain-containing protein [Desulfobacterales bacterium]